MKNNSRKCPYCDSEVSYFEALTDISKGEHTCINCNQNSNIVFSKKLYIPAAILLVIAVALAAVVFFLSGRSNLLLTAVVIIIPFAVFFFLTPLYYSLYPIKNAAITPVVRQKIKSKKRSQITPRAIKYEEKKRLEKEKKVMDNKENSFKSKFSKFVKTYIIVDDDEPEEKDEKFDIENDSDSEKTRIAKAIKEDDIDKLKRANTPDKQSEDKHSEDEQSDIDTVDPLAEEESYNFIGAYSDTNAYEKTKLREPVYHKLNKIKKVDFVYLPELIDVIDIDLNALDEEEEENEEILSFFDSKADDDYFIKKNENFNDIEPDHPEEEIKSYSENRIFQYTADEAESITVSLNDDNKKDEKSYVEMNEAETDTKIKAAKEEEEEVPFDCNNEEESYYEMTESEIDKAVEESKKSESVSDSLYDMIENESVDESSSDGDEYYAYQPDFYDEELGAEEEIDSVIEKALDDAQENNNEDEENQPRSFQEELDLSEYKTSSYVEDGSIDIELDYGYPEDQDEDFKFEDEQDDKFDESEDEPVNNEQELNITPIAEIKENPVKISDDANENAAKKKKAKPVEKKQNSSKKKNKKAASESEAVGLFSKIKNKLILATEQEREEMFKQEERERKLEDKERRRREKEKEKLLKEREERKNKGKDEGNSRSSVKKQKPVGSSINTGENDLDKKENSRSSVKKQKPVGSGVNADDYNEQEKIVIESVKDTVAKMKDKKISEEEKIKIISEKKNEELRQEELERLKAEQEKKRLQKEKKLKSKKLQQERQQKAEQLRQQQAEKAKANQQKLRESTRQRDVSDIKLTEIRKVRTKVSQKQEQKRQEVDKFF